MSDRPHHIHYRVYQGVGTAELQVTTEGLRSRAEADAYVDMVSRAGGRLVAGSVEVHRDDHRGGK